MKYLFGLLISFALGEIIGILAMLQVAPVWCYAVAGGLIGCVIAKVSIMWKNELEAKNVRR